MGLLGSTLVQSCAMWNRLRVILKNFGATFVHPGLRKSSEVEIVGFINGSYVFFDIHVIGRSLILGHVGVILGLSKRTWGLLGYTLEPSCATLGQP